MKSLADALGVASPQPDTKKQEPRPQTAKAISRDLLNSLEYRVSLIRRIESDTLPAAVECKLYEYAYGKPVDRVEVKDTTSKLEEMTSEELEARAMALATLARRMREGTIDPEVGSGDSTKVH